MTAAPNAAAARKRARRVAEGTAQREAESAITAGIPTQGQLMLPLMRAIERQGGRARPKDLYDDVAQQLGVPDEVRAIEKTFANGRTSPLFERQVRWARQTAILRGHIAAPERGLWELTAGGRNALRNVRPGIIITVFETEQGVAIGAQVEDAAGVLLPGSVDLLFTSPPFPLLSGKEYGTSSTAEWLEWMTELCRSWHDLLAPTGSLVLELNDVWYRGMPVQSQYIERLGIRLEDELGMFKPGRLLWENPARKGPLVWCGIRRVRLAPTAAPLLWMSKAPHPKADTNAVLKPYVERTRQRYLGQTMEPVERPSGLKFGARSFSRDNGGAIPGNVIRAGNASGNDAYARACKAAGLKPHPARMPPRVAGFVINLLTQPGDLVFDPFFGSGTTGAVAEKLGRRWIGVERSLSYLETAALRFSSAPGFQVRSQGAFSSLNHPI